MNFVSLFPYYVVVPVRIIRRNSKIFKRQNLQHFDINKKVKVKVNSSPTRHAGPEGFRRVKALSFRDNGTVMVVGCQPYAQAAFTPRGIPDE